MSIEVEKLEFIRTSEGRIGVGVSNPDGGEKGGFKVLKWCPDCLLIDAEKALLLADIKKSLEAL